MKKAIIICIVFANIFTLSAQKSAIDNFDESDINWQNKDLIQDEILGVSVEVAYATFLKSMKPKKTVIVAVLDSGVDIYHDDLDDKVWTNEDEIPDNNIDDDKNGYVDDIHGWNYLGNKMGENIQHENLEFTRIIKDEEHPLYEQAKALYEKELQSVDARIKRLEKLKQDIQLAKEIIKNQTDIEVNELDDLDDLPRAGKEVRKAKRTLKKFWKRKITTQLIDQILSYSDVFYDYYLNKEFNPREIVGDDPTDISDTDYGNNNVKGPRSEHGTGVAGIIAAERNNNIGINGVAENVEIMVLRAVPMGDERDKDIALAIRYAVDNGADMINMSFGKNMSPQKKFVDDAVKYAEENDVLLIHASGNDGVNIDYTENYPSDVYMDDSVATNYLSVGASSKLLEKSAPASFSNYGYTNVDIFAPGVAIVTLDSNNVYQQNSGTSFAAPVVTGVAALILSYYPELTSEELIDIILDSSFELNKPRKVYQPGIKGRKRAKVEFSTLSKTGGIVNAHAALLLAREKSNSNE